MNKFEVEAKGVLKNFQETLERKLSKGRLVLSAGIQQ
jgi:hypothetical protein